MAVTAEIEGTALSVWQPRMQGQGNKQINNVGLDRRRDGLDGMGGVGSGQSRHIEESFWGKQFT